MSYRLALDDELADSARACAREQLEGAIAQLEQRDENPVDAIHEARKHLKKARALLRLVRPALGRKAYRRENEALRDVARTLSGARDADVLVETAAALGERSAGRLPATAFDQLRDALAAERAAPDGGAVDVAPALAALRAASERARTWPLEGATWDAALAGLARAYARGRDAFAAARAEPTAERLHAWRKRAKDLWYHQRLLKQAWPDLFAAQIDAAHALTELLGDDHDLAVLDERLASAAPLAALVDADRAELRALVSERRAELQADAFALGRRVYAERPKAFARRLAVYVESATG